MLPDGSSGRGARATRRGLILAVLLVLVMIAALSWRAAANRQREMHERSGMVMGTFVTLRAAGPRAPGALDAAMAELGRLETLFSYNDAASDVSRLNAGAGRGPVQLAPEVIEVLVQAQRLAELSGGRFDVTVGPLVDIWGFRPDVASQAVPAQADIDAALALVDYTRLSVDAVLGQAELATAGMRVDLGGIAKGYAVDRVAAILRQAGIASAMLDVGGNIYALGLRPTGETWRVGLQHPRQSGDLLGILPITDLSIATSGDYQRYFEAGGVRYHHILDPQTGYPARTMAAISIVAASGLEADGVSTAAFVLGPEAGLALVRQLGLEAVVYTLDGQLEVTGGLQPLLVPAS